MTSTPNERVVDRARSQDRGCGVLTDPGEGDVGWILFPELLNDVMSNEREILRAMTPEPQDHRVAFDLSWALHRHIVSG